MALESSDQVSTEADGTSEAPMPVPSTMVVTLPNGHIPGSAPGVAAAVRSTVPHQEEKDLPGGFIVQKFGGTSIGKFAEQIANNVVGGAVKLHRVAIVCSARSSHTKSEGTTNRLLRAAREAEKGGSKEYIKIVDNVKQDHVNAAQQHVKDEALLTELIENIRRECEILVHILEATHSLEEVTAKSEDKIVSRGEKLSCLFMTALLKDHGIDATYIDVSEILSSGGKTTNRETDQVFYGSVAKILGEKVAECKSSVPVITGFFGNVPGGLLNTIGRGYTDLCAALVAVGIKADELQIWKEVDGVFTADPFKVLTARLLDSVTPAEASELTFYGSEVIHPFTMQQVMRAQIPIRVKNVTNPRCKGTVVLPDRPSTPATNGENKVRILRKTSYHSNGPKKPTAVTIKPNISIINVHSNKRTRAHGFLMNIFSILDQYRLSVDLISSSEVHVSLAIHSETAIIDDTRNDIQDDSIRGAWEALQRLGDVDIVPNMAIISLVGAGLRHMIGISGKFFSTLGANGINVEMISQGASEINISCVIAAADADRALNVVHTHLFTFSE